MRLTPPFAPFPLPPLANASAQIVSVAVMAHKAGRKIFTLDSP